MKSMNTPVEVIKHEGLVESLQELVGFLDQAFEEGQAAHEVEEGIWRRVLAMGRQAFGAFVGLLGDGDAGERVRLPDGREVKRLEKPHRRLYQSVFGLFEWDRVVYGSRKGQKIEYVPLDEQWQLPQGRLSYLLQDWDPGLAVEVPFAKVNSTRERMLGFQQSVHTLERSPREMAQAVSAFWREHSTPASEQEGAVLVCTADGKGVPMRGAGKAARAPECSSDSGMRPGIKKMALIGSVYSVDPYVRTPDEVLDALFRESPRSEGPPARPEPCFKYVRASLQRDEAGSTQPQTQEIFGWMAQQVAQRNPEGTQPMVLLMDGQQSLWDAGLQYLPQDTEEVTDILDLLHATGYLWEAAHLFHPKDSAAARRFAKEQIRRILHGEVNAVIHSLRWQGTHCKLKGKRLETLEGICGYLRNNAHRMAYDVYLQHGFPIASGVIEGACRCVVKDRMERSGMRWIMPGARALLDMRCLSLSNLWEEFKVFRIQAESQRLYPGLAANDSDLSPLMAA